MSSLYRISIGLDLWQNKTTQGLSKIVDVRCIPGKKCWYWKLMSAKSANHKPGSMEYIRFKYGSNVIDRQKSYEL